MRKYSYYNNGVINKRFYEGEEIPEGWYPGFVPMSSEVKERALEKRRKTNLEKYGVEFPSQSSEIQEKTEKTCMERYGTKAPSQNDEIKKKAAETNIERYGFYSSAMNPDVKKKAAETNIERYGFYSSAMNPDVKAKALKTCQERYGASSPSLSEEIAEKKRQTCLENFGVEYPMQSDEVRGKSKQSCLEKYGVEHASQADVVRDKVKRTCLERYGVDVSSKSEEVKERARQAFLERYGVENPSQSEEVKEKRRQTNIERFGVPCSFESFQVKEKTKQTCQERYGVDWPCQRPEARAYSNDSVPNKAFAEKLDELGIQYQREFPLGRYSFDFRVGDILIEIDPFATHNSLWGLFGSEGVDESYHYDKSYTAEEAGYHCIHIFDWDDPDKILELLASKERIFARKCELKNVDAKECNEFLMKHHIQGTCKGQSIILGLYFEGELVSLMSFGKPRYNKNFEYELLRYCSSKNIVGGAERLFKAFEKQYSPKSVISYCDRSKFTGNVYKKLGFTLRSSRNPSKHWYNPKSGKHLTDNLVRQRGVDQLLGTNYGKGTSNEDLLVRLGFVPIYDCGQDSYVWEV